MLSANLLSLFGLGQTLSDLGLVVKVLVFCYLLYWLFITFREQQVVLGIATIVAAYFMFFHAVSVTVLVLLFFVFIIMSGHFQFIIDMGLIPIFSMFGFKFQEGYGSSEAHEAQEMQEIQKKLQEGQPLTNEETDKFRAAKQKEAAYEERAHALLSGSAGAGFRG